MEHALRRALAFIHGVQQHDGGFAGQTSSTQYPFTPEHTYATTFTPALILGALADNPAALHIRKPLAAWLLAQRSNAWTFNYWARSAPERQTMPYPDDLDDTFCSITALHRHDPSLVDAKSLGEIIHILIAAETNAGGPYRTWLVDENAAAVWQDVDLAVNANVAYFLRLVAEPLPNVTKLIDTAIITGKYTSPYYPGPLPVLYFITRAYTGEHTKKLISYTLAQQPCTAIEQAVWCTALMRLGAYHATAPVLNELITTQSTDGSWPAGAFCLDPAQQGKTYYQGAAALTTALVAEALQLYTQRPSNSKQQHPAAHPPKHAAVIAAAKANFNLLQPELRAKCYAMLDVMAAGDTSQEIVLLPQLFATSLNRQPVLPPDSLSALSLANTYGWMAYTILDNFLDNEGEPQLLPAATTALRASVAAFTQAVPHNRTFQTLVQEAFDTIDSANTWELEHCRASINDDRIVLNAIPHYGQLAKLAERSIGHTLTPLGVITLAGYSLQSKAAHALRQSLRHYLIARQLLDDMHDWEHDIRSGQLTAVVAEILRQLRIKPGEYTFGQLLPKMQTAFWQYTLPQMCKRCFTHIRKARLYAEKSMLIAPKSPFYTLYDRLDNTLQSTLDSRANALKFLAGYKKPPA